MKKIFLILLLLSSCDYENYINNDHNRKMILLQELYNNSHCNTGEYHCNGNILQKCSSEYGGFFSDDYNCDDIDMQCIDYDDPKLTNCYAR